MRLICYYSNEGGPFGGVGSHCKVEQTRMTLRQNICLFVNKDIHVLSVVLPIFTPDYVEDL